MDTSNIISERFKQLPTPIQELVTSPETPKLIQALGQQHQLHIDAMGALEAEVLYVILGLQNPADLPKNIAEATHLSLDGSRKIAEEVNKKLLEPVRDAFHELYQTDVALAEDQEAEFDQEPELDSAGLGELQTNLPASAFSKAPKQKSEPDAPTETEGAKVPATPDAPPVEEVRLTEETNLPKTEREIDKLVKEKLPPKQTTPSTNTDSPDQNQPDDGIDPYREPIG